VIVEGVHSVFRRSGIDQGPISTQFSDERIITNVLIAPAFMSDHRPLRVAGDGSGQVIVNTRKPGHWMILQVGR
jgi:hypothetical protein